MIRYRDLAGVQFTPLSFAQLQLPMTAKFGDVFISPAGEVHWTSFSSNRTSVIYAEDGSVIDLSLPGGGQFFFPLVQKFSDGRWLVVEARTDTITPNAHLFGSNKEPIRSFYAGDGIQTVFADQRGKIWAGYFDEGIFGAFNPRPPLNHSSYRYGPSGLIRFDDHGNIEFSYNQKHPEKPIADIQALTLDDNDRAWFCPYTEFFLASVFENRVDFVLPKAPTALADAISVGPDFFAFFGGYKRSSMIAMVHRQSLRVRLIQLQSAEGGTLSPMRVATRGAAAIGASKDRLFRLDQQILLDALGPWTDDNTSSVASAVQYLDEEEAYADSYLIYPGDPQVLPGKPRPSQNPPRNDEDTAL